MHRAIFFYLKVIMYYAGDPMMQFSFLKIFRKMISLKILLERESLLGRQWVREGEAFIKIFSCLLKIGNLIYRNILKERLFKSWELVR